MQRMHTAHAVAMTATHSGGMQAILHELTNSCRFMVSVQNTSPQHHACQVVCLNGPPPHMLPDRPNQSDGGHKLNQYCPKSHFHLRAL